MEFCIVNDEGVVEDGFYSRSEAEEQLKTYSPEDGCEICIRSNYDEDGFWIEFEE